MTRLRTPSQREQLHERGYLLTESLLDRESFIEPVLEELAGVVSLVASEWERGGVVSRTWERERFEEQLLQLTREVHDRSDIPPLTSYMDITLPKGGINETTPLYLGEACFRLLTAPPLLDALQDIIGPEIWLNPVGHVRIKVPESQARGGYMTKTDWHQDNGVVLEEADSMETLTVWVPLTRSTVANGCLTVLPARRDQALYLHCDDLAIPLRMVSLENAIPLPMEVGSVLFMHPRTPHASLENASRSEVRISLDLRYQPSEEPTGRPQFPAFCLRHPNGTSTSWSEWSHGWLEARTRLAEKDLGAFDRWASGASGCA